MKTQTQIFYDERKKIAGADELFMEMVKEGMTRDELVKLIEKRPELWGRFSNWIGVLP